MALTMWIYFVINLWIELLMSTPHLVDVARKHCPYSDFCTMPRAFNFTPTDEVIPCCSQCSCDESCWKLDICCPDIKTAKPPGSQRYTIECTTTRFAYFNKYVENYNPVFFSYQPYRIITTCPPTYEDTTVVNKCVNSTMFMPETYDDIVVMSDASYNDIIFRNKHCAKCNGVMQIQRWKLVTTFCESSTLPETKLTGPELYKFIISHCDVKSIPPSKVTLTNSALCSDNIISSCNVTGKWDNYDAAIDEACSSFYLLYFEELKSYTVQIYQSVFCYQCNRAAASVSNILETEPTGVGTASIDGLCSSKWLFIRSPLTNQKFTAFIDTSLSIAALEAQHNSATGICAVNEIYDPQTKICHHLHCPINSNPFNGRCLSNSLDVFGLPIRLQMALIPIENISISAVTMSIKRISMELFRKMKLTHCMKCYTVMLVNNNGIHGYLQSVIFEWNILTDHLCQLDKIEKSIRHTTQNKLFNLRTEHRNIPTIVRFLYENNDIYELKQDIIYTYYPCDLGQMSWYEITPVSFCPHIVMNETELKHFFRITERAFNVRSTMMSNSNITNLKLFKMKFSNKTSPQTYATCVENILWQRNRGGRICCSLSVYLCLFVAGILYFCRIWFQTRQYLS